MDDAKPEGLTRLEVLIDQDQKEDIKAVTAARRIRHPRQRIRMATVVREALDVGLEDQKRRYLPPADPTETEQ